MHAKFNATGVDGVKGWIGVYHLRMFPNRGR